MELGTNRTQGAALPIVLVMMLVLTIAGIAGLRLARSELQLTGVEQFYSAALYAAESGISSHIAGNVLNDVVPGTIKSHPTVTLSTSIKSEQDREYLGAGNVPGDGFSEEYAGFHYEIEATGNGPNNATVTVVQGVYLVAGGGL